MAHLLASVSVFQGTRVSETVGLQRWDFDLERDVLHIRRIVEQESGLVYERTKGNDDGIVVPLFPRVKELYLRLLNGRAPLSREFIFQRKDGSHLTTYQARGMIERFAKNAKIRNVTPHVLRATFATIAEESGWSKEEIQRLMGHSTVLVTERYTSHRVKHLVERAKEIGFGASAETKNVVKIRGKK